MVRFWNITFLQIKRKIRFYSISFRTIRFVYFSATSTYPIFFSLSSLGFVPSARQQWRGQWQSTWMTDRVSARRCIPPSLTHTPDPLTRPLNTQPVGWLLSYSVPIRSAVDLFISTQGKQHIDVHTEYIFLLCICTLWLYILKRWGVHCVLSVRRCGLTGEVKWYQKSIVNKLSKLWFFFKWGMLISVYDLSLR
jgi:hypothetical protein